MLDRQGAGLVQVDLLPFFLKRRRHPRSTLFPYTTLFRSLDGREYPGRGQTGAHRARQIPGAHDDRDRKSTRLNSSHAVISYAVFCLKKKNTPGEREAGDVLVAHLDRALEDAAVARIGRPI